MYYYASKTHNSLNGEEYRPESIHPGLCVNPYYPVRVYDGARFMIDSGAFQDVGEDTRLSFEDALNRQLEYEKTLTPEGRPAYAIVSYDRLVDEQFNGVAQIKERVPVSKSEPYIRDTIEASKFLASKRAELRPRKLILSCQGTTADQYIYCLNEVLKVAQPGDIIGFGGFCIISKSKEYERQFYDVINRAFPIIAEAGLNQCHIFGVGIMRVLIQAEVLAQRYGLNLSYDTSSYEVNAIMGRIFDPLNGQITGVFNKKQKKNGYIPSRLAYFNIRTIRAFWDNFASLPIQTDFIAGAE